MPAGPKQKPLVQCNVCRRSFEESRIRKHQDICKKSMKMKRKPFDSFKQRVRGTVLEKHVETIKTRLQEEPSPKMCHGNWRKDHEEFINTIKAAKLSHPPSSNILKADFHAPSLQEYQMHAL